MFSKMFELALLGCEPFLVETVTMSGVHPTVLNLALGLVEKGD